LPNTPAGTMSAGPAPQNSRETRSETRSLRNRERRRRRPREPVREPVTPSLRVLGETVMILCVLGEIVLDEIALDEIVVAEIILIALGEKIRIQV
jgi:hypothetical protein